MPVDYNKNAATDDWSGDFGCGVSYFSQDAVIRLAPAAGIALSDKLSPPKSLRSTISGGKGPGNAKQIFETIGTYLGYTIVHYSDIYDINCVQLLGRVTSGVGGDIIINQANKVLKSEFPSVAEKIKLYIPDEYERRVGQSIAAASLPEVKG